VRLQPINERILAKEVRPDKMTQGGIVLPEGASHPTKLAEIMELGAGALIDGQRIPFSVSVGDTVMLNSRAGQQLSADGEKFILIVERDVLAVVKRD
jgi:chaperonin GroES